MTGSIEKRYKVYFALIPYFYTHCMPNQDCDHDWRWEKTKRIGPANGGPEELYYCQKCMGYEYASKIGKPVLGH